jgi:hypothetical protein
LLKPVKAGLHWADALVTAYVSVPLSSGLNPRGQFYSSRGAPSYRSFVAASVAPACSAASARLMIDLIDNGVVPVRLEFTRQLVARGGMIIFAGSLSQSAKC